MLAAVAVASVTPTANAQPGYQPRPSASSPAYSPYLNLTRPGNLANNYFGLVRPQIDTMNSVYQLQQQYGALNQSIANPTSMDQQLPPPTTGHAATFMAYGHYYPAIGGANRGGARPAAGATAAPARR
jgi:hypothetical protein